jgi:hypothetical protein
MPIRDIYLKIEEMQDYSPVEPQDNGPPPIQYRRAGLRNPVQGRASEICSNPAGSTEIGKRNPARNLGE